VTQRQPTYKRIYKAIMKVDIREQNAAPVTAHATINPRGGRTLHTNKATSTDRTSHISALICKTVGMTSGRASVLPWLIVPAAINAAHPAVA